jgi:hypothetical protein
MLAHSRTSVTTPGPQYDLCVRRVPFAAGLLLALICIGAWSAEAKQNVPTLGSKRYPPQGYGGPRPGFGTIAPKLVSANGDPGSVVYDLRWRHWGSAQTIGYGKTYAPGPHGGWTSRLVPSELRASDLGRCLPGHPIVYRHLEFRSGKGRHWGEWPYPQPLC